MGKVDLLRKSTGVSNRTGVPTPVIEMAASATSTPQHAVIPPVGEEYKVRAICCRVTAVSGSPKVGPAIVDASAGSSESAGTALVASANRVYIWTIGGNNGGTYTASPNDGTSGTAFASSATYALSLSSTTGANLFSIRAAGPAGITNNGDKHPAIVATTSTSRSTTVEAWAIVDIVKEFS